MIAMADAARVHARLSWLRLKRGRILWVVGAMWALPLVYAVGLAIAGHWGRGLFDDVCELYFRFLVPFVPALLASSALAEEIENKTFTFVFARPAPRGAIVLGKWATATLSSIAVVVPSLAAMWLVAHARFASDMAAEWPHLLRVEAAAVLGLMLYGSLAIAVGMLFSRHPVIAMLAFLLLVDLGLGSMPVLFNVVAPAWHLRNLAELPLPTSEMGFLVLRAPAWISASVTLLLTPLFLLLCILGVNGAEYRTDR